MVLDAKLREVILVFIFSNNNAFFSFCVVSKQAQKQYCGFGSRVRGFITCAADFSLLNLPKGKSLGRSKPATNS